GWSTQNPAVHRRSRAGRSPGFERRHNFPACLRSNLGRGSPIPLNRLPPEPPRSIGGRPPGPFRRSQEGSSDQSGIAQGKKDKPDKNQPAPDPFPIQKNMGIFEYRFPHDRVQPQDGFGVQEVAQTDDNKQEPQGDPEQEHVEKSIKIRREESMKDL